MQAEPEDSKTKPTQLYLAAFLGHKRRRGQMYETPELFEDLLSLVDLLLNQTEYPLGQRSSIDSLQESIIAGLPFVELETLQ